MSGDGSITLPYGDGMHVFRLRIGELRELEEKRNDGPYNIYQRLAVFGFRVDDIRETLRLGLIGGGMSPHLALGMVSKYTVPPHLMRDNLIARAVLQRALIGDESDPVGKELADALAAMARPTASSTSEPGASDGRQSLETPPQSDGHPGSSISAASGSSQPPSMAGNGRMVPRFPEQTE